MSVRTLSSVSVTLLAVLLSVAQADHKLQKASKSPEGLPKKISALLDPAGYRVVGPDGVHCEIWLVKELALRPGFKPSLTVKYPFTSGQLIGAIRVPGKVEFTDFRGQKMPAGAYTLRYALRPEDGDHIGTSETFDFLVAISAKADDDPADLKELEKLNEKSADAVGTTHPATFTLLPSEKPPKQASLEHNEANDFWILHLAVTGIAKEKKVDVPLRLVVLGQAEE